MQPTIYNNNYKADCLESRRTRVRPSFVIQVSKKQKVSSLLNRNDSEFMNHYHLVTLLWNTNYNVQTYVNNNIIYCITNIF